ncbi:MAG: hypothetical protein FWH43_07935 [Endomicrobia bacterium]|nr:hypothetical protein [Endomicrobiia bacterium]
MKKAISAVFLSAFFAVTAVAGNVSSIQNEYWNWDSGTPQALAFENYFFSEDGTFRFSWGYSGSSYYGGWHAGTYFYDAEKQKIVFNSVDKGTMGLSKETERPAPKELKILEFIDGGLVRIDMGAAHQQSKHQLFDGFMTRHIGRIKEQKWTFMHYTLVYEFYFDPEGSCFFKEGKQGSDIDSQYECEYNIADGILFLQVNSAMITKFNTKKSDNVKYDPPAKTYIRLGKSSGGEIQVENVNFSGILGGSRGWNCIDGKYIIENKLPAVKQKDFYTYKIERTNSGDVLIESETDLIK